MKKISVVVPVYRTPAMALERCVNSIINQTYSELEIIIVDDGNADSYQQLFYTLKEKDPRIKIVHQKNMGVSVARNQGIKHATGEYISFVDSDDYLDLDFFAKMLDAAGDNDIVICAVAGSSYPTEERWCDRRFFFSKPSLFDTVQYINFPVNKLYKTSILTEYNIQFPPGVGRGEDALFLYDYYKHCMSFQIIPDALYYYVYYSDSAMRTYTEDYWKWEKEVIQKQWEMFHQYPLTDEEDTAMRVWLYYKYRGAAYYYLEKEPDRRKANKIIGTIAAFPLLSELKKIDLSANNKLLSTKGKVSVCLFNCMGKYGTQISYRLRRKRAVLHKK